MAKFKKIDPNYQMSSTGNSLGVSVDVLVKVDDKDVFVSKSSVDAYPSIPKSDAFTLENQLKAGVQLKEVSVGTLSADVDRLDEQVKNLVSRADEFEKMLNPQNEE